MHTWCSPGRIKYGSRAPSRSAIRSSAGLFQSVSIFARETSDRYLMTSTLSASDCYLINIWLIPYELLIATFWPRIATFWPILCGRLMTALSTSDRDLISFWSLPYQPLIAPLWPLPCGLLIATLSTSDRYLLSHRPHPLTDKQTHTHTNSCTGKPKTFARAHWRQYADPPTSRSPHRRHPLDTSTWDPIWIAVQTHRGRMNWLETHRDAPGMAAPLPTLTRNVNSHRSRCYTLTRPSRTQAHPSNMFGRGGTAYMLQYVCPTSRSSPPPKVGIRPHFSTSNQGVRLFFYRDMHDEK